MGIMGERGGPGEGRDSRTKPEESQGKRKHPRCLDFSSWGPLTLSICIFGFGLLLSILLLLTEHALKLECVHMLDSIIIIIIFINKT